MKIYFKNGDVAEDVPQEIVNILRDKMLDMFGKFQNSNIQSNWQCFSDPSGKCILMINMLEVNYIR